MLHAKRMKKSAVQHTIAAVTMSTSSHMLRWIRWPMMSWATEAVAMPKKSAKVAAVLVCVLPPFSAMYTVKTT